MKETKAHRIRPSEQVYERYTEEDFAVWKTLYQRQRAMLEGKVADAFLEALERIGFSPERIPHFGETNERLQQLTGWRLVTVPNISPVEDFFARLANRQFTATCWLRRMEELDYLEEPDMFHDVFGHAPLLTHPDYTTFFHRMGRLAQKYRHQPAAILKLQRLYWFTIEFGLIRHPSGELRIYGAGIISSPGETKHALSSSVAHHPFDIHQIYQHAFRTDVVQEEYYVIDSFEELVAELPAFEAALEGPG